MNNKEKEIIWHTPHLLLLLPKGQEGGRKGLVPCISWGSHQEALSGQNSSVAGLSSLQVGERSRNKIILSVQH